MSEPDGLQVRIVKGDTVFHVHGERAGTEGVWLGKGQVEGIYDAPVKTTYKSSAFQVGSKQKAKKWLHRDMLLGCHVVDTAFATYSVNDSEFRKLFDYEEDFWDDDYEPTTVELETEMSGVRNIDVLLHETPRFAADIDPQKQQYGNLILPLRAGQPMWYEKHETMSGHWEDSFSALTATGSGTVTVYNPTDQVMYQKWILTQATWELPDYQWVGGRGEREPGGSQASRTVSDIEVTALNGGAVVDLDGNELMFRDANDTNILGQLAGQFFNFPIPPYTPPTDLPVSYTGAPGGGAMVRLVQPRMWSRPWGLERI
jgi:hypothetical protein